MPTGFSQQKKITEEQERVIVAKMIQIVMVTMINMHLYKVNGEM